MTDRIYTAMAGTDSGGNLFKIDAIKHEGKLWLVPHWLEAPAAGLSRPARIIRFDNQPHQEGGVFADYILNGPVPRELLDSPTPTGKAFSFEYVELPDIDIPASIRPLHMGKPVLN